MSDQNTKTFGQIAYEAAFHPYCPSCEWFNLSAMEQQRWQHVADEVKFAVCTNIDPKSFRENAPYWNDSEHQQSVQTVQEMRRFVDEGMRGMDPEDRKAADEFIYEIQSLPQRYPVLSAEQAGKQRGE